MIQSDKLAYLTDLSGSRGRTSGETALSAHSEEHSNNTADLRQSL